MISGYFDYNATTPVSDDVAQVMKATIDLFANPSGINRYSAANKDILNRSRENVARLLGTEAAKIFFTSGGSEANNWAIKSTLLQHFKTPGHIITTAIEHPSVLNTVKYYAEKFGFEVTFVFPQANGAVAIDDIVSTIRPDTQLVSMMHANNETGVIQPVEAIAQITRQRNIKFHVDGVQVIGKRRVNVEKLGIDYLSFSGHKFHGPKGIGGLYVRDIEGFSPLIHGGGQEMGWRAGTENLVAIVGLSKAAEEADSNLDQWDVHNWECKRYLMKLLNKSRINFRFNGLTEYENSISNTLNILIPGARAEALAALMEVKSGIIVSIGSACSNNKTKKLSHVLEAMGMSEREIQGSIRVSFGRFTTLDDIQKFVQSLESCTSQLLEISLVA
ncbi:cysteine desulfurase family protein [Nodularia spumigena]|jgi:cysteine desulfurase|uniref:cysteine desulfurase family protein n=1 Tax=Nodularia spumigena TaxID=70799 RepID=UPI00232F7879|nr:cysteine desulfurase family protein [Nodularia spumigena]MDB9318007.1 cysteine desulfurase family protein [Nodularia spumigena CS-590/01A]MDB9321281.1 cysteine desulfurase family protein [Nodularia spumigena CS-591/07A]MDB9325877.1 cysteine desulfurase family protein [Nodularia spumigena CS-590/02]MDB9331768.1 cysteine desulfurase family protein [Nodularia spumigena CS-591/04]MDB9337120.1 cysteine desulfurase family protein [Nodularia spumigena CS-590/01]